MRYMRYGVCMYVYMCIGVVCAPVSSVLVHEYVVLIHHPEGVLHHVSYVW
jgi:hypothetical protein